MDFVDKARFHGEFDVNDLSPLFNLWRTTSSLRASCSLQKLVTHRPGFFKVDHAKDLHLIQGGA